MSYILEALRKLEQKRQWEKMHDDFTFLEGPIFRERNHALWPYLVLAALLLNAGIMVWWLAPWRTAHPVSEAAKVRAEPEPRREPAMASVMKSKTPDAIETKAPVPDRSPIASVKPPTEKKRRTASRPAVEPKEQARSTHTGEVQSNAVPERRAAASDELPTTLKSGIPQLKISVHYYAADPGSRFIRINDKTLREGQEVMTGLRVEEITATGVIFAWQGYRFRHGVDEPR